MTLGGGSTSHRFSAFWLKPKCFIPVTLTPWTKRRAPDVGRRACGEADCGLYTADRAMKSLLILSLLGLAVADPLPIYKRCDSKGELVSLDFTPCIFDSSCTTTCKCKIPRGSNVTLHATFKPDSEVTSVKPKLYAYFMGVRISAPFTMETDSCTRFNHPCPLQPDTAYEYSSFFHVPLLIPTLAVVVELDLRDQQDNSIFCFQVPVKIM